MRVDRFGVLKALIVLVVGLTALILQGCAKNGTDGANKNSGLTLNPVKLFSSNEKPAAISGAGAEIRPVKVAVDQEDLKKAIHRYRLTSKIKSGAQKIIGADLNGDGRGEALVYFHGDEWCISTGCRMVVFVKRENGFRPMSAIKRVKLPVLAAPSSTNGWRDIIVKTGNKDIGVKTVALKFNGAYPLNASIVSEKLAEAPAGTELLFGDETMAAGVN